MEKLIGRHRVHSSSGHTYEVLEYQRMIDASTHDGPGQIGGMKRFQLSDGSPVNYVDDSTFSIVLTGETVTRL